MVKPASQPGPKVLLFQPAGVRRCCFGERDLEQLRTEAQVVIPELNHPQDLARAWADLAPDCDALVSGWGTPPISDAMLDRAPRLQAWVHAAGTIRHLLPPTIWDRGIRIATSNEALAVGVAETTLGLIIAGVKGFFPCSRYTRSGGWSVIESRQIRVRELYDLTIGIIGASQVGRHLIRLLRQFEVDVLVYDPYLSESDAEWLGVRKSELDPLMARSDVVSLCAPALPSTRKMLGQTQFSAMRDDAIFINTARGSIVDESALVAELRTGRIWAFLDVTDPEPPLRDHPFRSLPNVVLLPHIAGTIGNGRLRLGRSVVTQLRQFFAGNEMSGEIDQERFAVMA